MTARHIIGGAIAIVSQPRWAWSGRARKERRVVDEVLDILRQNHQITEQQHLQLNRRAERERQHDLRRMGAPALKPPAAVAGGAPAPAAPMSQGDTMRLGSRLCRR